jgi:hypothetical protein
MTGAVREPSTTAPALIAFIMLQLSTKGTVR